MLPSLLDAIENIQNAFSFGQTSELRQIANQCIRRAALENDRLLAQTAVIAYALHKLLIKEHVQRDTAWKPVQKKLVEKLRDAHQQLEQKKTVEFEKQLNQLSDQIRKIDSALGNYIQNLIEKSKVKQASSLYALGVSLGQATELTQANKKTLFNYIGVTKLHDQQPAQKTMAERVAALEAILE